jgi:hypothetical protein
MAGRAIATAIARVVPAIHVLLAKRQEKKDVDARHKVHARAGQEARPGCRA